MKKLTARIKASSRRMRDAYVEDSLFHENEVQASRMVCTVLLISGAIMLLVWIAAVTGLFSFARDLAIPAVIQGLVEILILCAVSWRMHHDAWWLRYLLLIGATVVFARIDMMLTHKAALLIVIPVVCSCRYFSRRLSIGVAVLSAVLFLFSAAYGATHGLLNLNDLTLPVGTTMTTTGRYIDSAVDQVGYDPELLTRNVLLFSYLPKLMLFTVVAVISVRIASRGRQMVQTQKHLVQESSRIETELDLATRIQAGMLPNVFPPFPEHREFDIYALMDPAKEVGGDFYDFFLIDESHLGLVIADVSGKGVPAALFMMASKILVQTSAMDGLSPAKVLESINQRICAGSHEEMFVSVWLGVLDLNTGKLTAANAGHEYPALRKPDGGFELVHDRHGLVVGGMEGVRYRDYELQLLPGSRLFVYTDGVPEATSAQVELFGKERMLAALNENPAADAKTILSNVRAAVDRFVGDAPQFDDLTMMCLSWLGKGENP